ncbi:glycosyltransferase family 4 protein [Dehalococcoidia bacterium]|nr:glycosyltransferase family 4 protein [Dehalococcoidia bacterium]
MQEFVKRGWKVAFVYPVDTPQNSYQEDGIQFLPIYFPLRTHHQRSSHITFWERQRLRLSPVTYMTLFPFKVWPLLHRSSVQLLYAHGAQAAVVGAFFRLLYRIPLVARLYGIGNSPDSILGEVPFSLRNLYCDLPTILALKVRADLYVITDDGTRGREVLAKFGLAKQGLVLRNGVEVPQSLVNFPKHILREDLGLNAQRTVITFVGRIEGQKRCDRILQVAIEAYRQKRPWMFVLVGDGRDKVSLESQSQEYGLGKMIRFVGAVAHEEVWRYLYASNLFLALPDLSSLSNTLLEALAVGIPVVCSRKGEGTAELVVDGFSGHLVNDPDDPMEVIQRIDESLRIPKRRVLESVTLQSWESRLEREFEQIRDILKYDA